jgi:hypothetical protein
MFGCHGLIYLQKTVIQLTMTIREKMIVNDWLINNGNDGV